MNLKSTLIAVAVVAVVGLFSAAYVVDETEQVVITRFGRVIGAPQTMPGLKFKMPLIDQANYFPKNLQEWDGDPGQIPTLDKTYIWVDAFARWKIVDPIKFFQTVGNRDTALGRLDDIIDPAVRNFITSFSLIESVRKSNRELMFEMQDESMEKKQDTAYRIQTGREKITLGIMRAAQPKLTEFGIELVDVKIKRINYVEQVQQSVYGRMIAERKQIAEKFRSEGKGEAQKILGMKERDLKQITSEAYKVAQDLKGKADAKVTQITARAYGNDPEFYSFVRTLEIYNQALQDNTSLVLSTDSEFLRYLKGYSNGERK